MHYNFRSILRDNGFVNYKGSKNIFIQLFNALKKAIIEHDLNQGVKLPPTRVLAKDLEISRSTVLKAYELLILEKYVNSKHGSGYFVADVKAKKNRFIPRGHLKKSKFPKISKKGKAFKQNLLNQKENKKGVAFRPGLPPLDVFPVNLWKNLSNNYWKNVKASDLSYANTIGEERLRQNIADYLKIYRNISCHPDQIVITTGSLHSLSMIGDALINRGDQVIIENPTYPHANVLFKSLRANVIPATIDDQGVVIKGLKCVRPKLIYTTPSNQYPTGVKMSLNRRLELLEWAALNKTVIIEDDYDHEFSNWENPISSIFSLDAQQRTIYLGTFNKLLHPSIRVGYMIVPDFLSDTIKALYEQSSRFVSPITQSILSSFIEKDYLNKHLRKIIEVSLERKALFLKCFKNEFNNEILINDHTGLHIIGKIDSSISDVELSSYFKNEGIITHPYSSYFINGISEQGLVMGYSSVNNKVIKETIYKMKQKFESFKKTK